MLEDSVKVFGKRDHEKEKVIRIRQSLMTRNIFYVKRERGNDIELVRIYSTNKIIRTMKWKRRIVEMLTSNVSER